MSTGWTDLGWARPDTGREARLGLPEVVYGPGKTAAQVTGIVRTLLAANTGPVLVTRLEPDVAAEVAAAVPGARHDEPARLLVWRPAAPRGFRLAVVAAGTSDGPDRILAERDRLAAADAVVCVAGMEGALPSVVGGLVGCPVVAVPTSVGHGAAFEGVTALLAMLSSCAAGVVVVNIDSGFSAAMAAFRLATRVRR